MDNNIKPGDKVFLKNEMRIVGILRNNGDLEIDDRIAESEILMRLYDQLIFIDVKHFNGFLGWQAGRTTKLTETLSLVEILK